MTVGLNPDQQQAAECLSRPVLVSAGAGSGKTRMLTQRFINAVVPGAVKDWQPADVNRVLAITFTEKAAGEVAERVRLALFAASCAEESRRLADGWISTIHGLCSRLLRRHAFDAGIDPLFKVADTIEANALAERAFEDSARVVLDRGVDGQRLLDSYAFAELFKATKSVVRELSVAGLTTGALSLESPRTPGQLLADATTLFRAGIAAGDCGYQGSSSDPKEHVVRCEEALSSCVLINDQCDTDRERLERLLLALRRYRPVKSLKGTEDAATEFSETRVTLIRQTVSALGEPLARAFAGLVVEYSVRYGDAKAVAGLLDFDDLQSKAVELLERRPDLAAAYRERFRIVMVDEFQDTDAIQLRLVDALSDGNLCTVGDEKQSIYRFRGADIAVYRAHRDQMVREGALVCNLQVNYRSHEDILGFINEAFGSAEYFGKSLDPLVPPPEGRASDPLDDVLGDRPRVDALFVDGTGAAGRVREAEEIASRFKELREAGVPAGSMAILLRRYRYAHVYAQALSRVDMAGIIVGGSRFFGLCEVSVMRALGRAIANTEDSAAVGQLLVSDFIPVSDDALAVLRAEEPETDRGASLWRLIHGPKGSLTSGDRESLERVAEVVDRARQRVGRMPISEVLLRAVEEAGYDLRLLAGGNVGKDAFANVLKFVRLADAYEDAGGVGLAGFVPYLDTKERLNDTAAPVSLSDDGSQAVRIMSIHASKGLEFPVVAVPDLASSGGGDAPLIRTSLSGGCLRISIRKSAEEEAKPEIEQAVWFSQFTAQANEAEMQEQARVLYVACTRAREILVVSGSTNLSPKSGTKASNDLVRLSRILGLRIPIEGPSDETLILGGAVPFRRIVVEAADTPLTPAQEDRPANLDAPLPPIPQPFGDAEESCRLPERLSYTQMTEFERCPRRFWIRRVLGIKPVEVRSDEADPLAFGTALHVALRLAGSDRRPLDAERLGAIARYFELDDSEVGRLSDAVRSYCESEVADTVAAAKTVRRESPFALSITEGAFALIGSIDVYARTGDSAVIVDYKSGASGKAGELEECYRLQADCYALAVLKDGCTSVSVEFVRPEVVSADGTLQRTSYSYAVGDAMALEADILARYTEIEQSDFAPKPSWEQCSRCAVPERMCRERSRRAARGI